MVAFAANSLLCRAALRGDLIDPVSFTSLRLMSGALVLLIIVQGGSVFTRARRRPGSKAAWGGWISAAALFGYAMAFSLAYVTLDTGMGALVLFGAVQATMIGGGILSGERPRAGEWAGLALALGGLAYLTVPGAGAPNPFGLLFMTISGISWGIYSLRGRGVTDPLRVTAGSFLRATPVALVASILVLPSMHAEAAGIVLAVVSGAITSGLGYALWYRALRGLTMTRAAIVQLLVPVLAALGGVMLLDERITFRLVAAGLAIGGGVCLAVSTRTRLGTERRKVGPPRRDP